MIEEFAIVWQQRALLLDWLLTTLLISALASAAALALGAWLAVTGLFGLCFLGIELYEFAHMIHLGATPQRSASAGASPRSSAQTSAAEVVNSCGPGWMP